MAIATLSIDLVAQLARFEADMGRAARVAEAAAKRIDGAFVGVGAVFTGSLLANAATEAGRQLVTLVPALVDSVGHFQDLEEQTGASAVALAAFTTAGDVAGVSADQLAGFMVKLTASLAKTDDESKGAGAALKALGLNLAEFKELAPEDQFTTLAQRLDAFEDGSKKTAIAVALLGKSGAEALPFLKELAASGLAQNRLTAEQIRLADDYADRNAKLRSELRQAAQVAALQVLPAFSALSGELIRAAKNTLDAGEESGRLGRNNGIREFAENSAIAVAVLGESIAGVAKAIRALAGSAEVVGADTGAAFDFAKQAFSAFLPGDAFDEATKDLDAQLSKREQVLKEANQRYIDLLEKDGTEISRRLRAQFSPEGREATRLGQDPRELARRGRPVGGNRPQLDVSGLAGDDAAKQAASEAQRAREALLQQAIRGIEEHFSRVRDAFSFQGEFLEGEYSAGLISLRAYYGERDAIEQKELAAQLQANQRKIDALASYRLTLKAGSADAIKVAGEIADVEADSARAREDYSRRAALSTQKQTEGYKQLRDQVSEFAAQIKQLQGDDFGAAQIRAEQAIQNARRLAAQDGGTFDEDGYRRLLENVNRLSEAQRQLGVATSRTAAEEEIFRIRSEARGASLAETEAGVYAIRQRGLEQLRALSAQADALANGARPDSPAALFAQQLRVELERAAEAVDPALDRIRSFSDDVASSVSGAVGSAIDDVSNLSDAVDNLGDSLKRITIDALVTEPLEANLRGMLRGLTTGDGQIGQFVKGLFGAPSAAGAQASSILPGESGGIPDGDLPRMLAGLLGFGGRNGDPASPAIGAATNQAAGAAQTAAQTTAITAAIATASGTETAALTAAISTASAAETAGLTTAFSAGLTAASAAITAAITASTTAITTAIAAKGAQDAGGDALAAFAASGFDSGGYTGPGGKFEPAGIVHRGEVVWSQSDVRRAGGVAVVEGMRRGLRGYASGGIVDDRQLAPQLSAVAAPAARGRSDRGGATVHAPQHFHYHGAVDRRTQLQTQADAARGLREAARNL